MNCSYFAISIRSLRQFCCDFYGWARETKGETNCGFPTFLPSHCAHEKDDTRTWRRRITYLAVSRNHLT